MDGKVNFAGGWDKLWSSIQGLISGDITNILTIIGVLMVVFAIGKYLFDKRRGGGATQGLAAVMWVMGIGALLAAPQVVFPIALRILDTIINLIIGVINAAMG